MSLEEARKILGEGGKDLTDDSLERLINDLDFLAREEIKVPVNENETKT